MSVHMTSGVNKDYVQYGVGCFKMSIVKQVL